MLRLTCRINGVQNVRSVIGKKMPVYAYFILFSIVFVGIVFALISQLNTITADQGMSKMSANMSGMQGMSKMSANMSGMQGMSKMSANMSGMQGMSKMSANMSGMQGMSGVLGISPNEESIFLEWMFIAIAGLVGIPFAWVIIRERKKNSNRTNTVPKDNVDKI